MQQTGKRYLAAAIVNPSYDLDGNLIKMNAGYTLGMGKIA